MSASRVRLLIFDLDGTLIDSREDLAAAVNATRRYMGLPPLDAKLVASYVGDGAPMLMRRALGPQFSEQDIQRALEYFLDYYGEHKLDATRPYPGVAEGLERFARAGVKMAVLTNKPVRISQAILEGLGMARYFFAIYGGNSFPEKKPHPIGVETLCREAAVGPAETMLVGDSAVDVRTARNAGILACGVTYGFQPESLAAEPPDLLVGSLAELADRLGVPALPASSLGPGFQQQVPLELDL
ncbi:MAG: phosphoglycolate phosphatase [Bryobacterales bacterium]|nr:phosphoglycolate phosphatase [Bryobacterales bacterium]